VIGAAFYIWIPELLSGFDRYRSIIYAVLLLVAIMVFPEGLVGVFHQLRRVARFRFRPRDRTAAPSAGTDT
jgi:branched-chain amino acid transport system permease protein